MLPLVSFYPAGALALVADYADPTKTLFQFMRKSNYGLNSLTAHLDSMADWYGKRKAKINHLTHYTKKRLLSKRMYYLLIVGTPISTSDIVTSIGFNLEKRLAWNKRT